MFKQLQTFLVAAAVLLPFAGCTDIGFFNPNFLVESGAKQGPEQQVTPSNAKLLLIRVTNNTDFKVTFKSEILRQLEGKIDGPSIEFLDPAQSVGMLLENCDTDAVLVVKVKPLTQEKVQSTNIELPEVFVWVDGFPIPPSDFPRPLLLGQDFKSGDTIEFIISTLPTDVDRFRVTAAIYKQ